MCVVASTDGTDNLVANHFVPALVGETQRLIHPVTVNDFQLAGFHLYSLTHVNGGNIVTNPNARTS
jgi:hypothetical protein